jgi:hypothetical protein
MIVLFASRDDYQRLKSVREIAKAIGVTDILVNRYLAPKEQLFFGNIVEEKDLAGSGRRIAKAF